MFRFQRLATAMLCSFAAILASGCGDGAPPIGLVTGKVTYKGKPVAAATVSFMPTNGRPSWGITDAEGNYKLHWDEDHDGAEVDQHRVTIAFVPGSPGEEAAEAAGKAVISADRKEIITRYGNFETSTLQREVKPGTQVIDLVLD
jgi:hypothetical protein